ncbi:hypothetical protein KP509_13G022600 [Ceratopteris richardii]|uniref:ER membrane protein complex subunit 7 beta-sandwich domain-containing protein n=1 Tax=Ceratopteris richardii TaxID=49495 RepID=A0A8T2TJH4_CERRI|nr:hypothetical protein KP509_13G022600 [Ceratopteris richardii]
MAISGVLSLLPIVVAVGFFTAAIPISGAGEYTIAGRIRHSRAEGLSGNKAPFKTLNIKVILNAGQRVAFVRPDGYFAFSGIPAGTHLLEVVAPGYFFSPVRVDVSARLNGQLQAFLTETRRVISEPLMFEPLREEEYFEKREPFSIMGLLKSPMGLMVGFMVMAVFLLPKLMENIDPEEMKRMQEEMRNSPAPSFGSLLQGRTS